MKLFLIRCVGLLIASIWGVVAYFEQKLDKLIDSFIRYEAKLMLADQHKREEIAKTARTAALARRFPKGFSTQENKKDSV